MTNKKLIAGIDEVGIGSLAGPVVSAVVILKNKINKEAIKDSKKISFKKRVSLSEYIKKNSWFAVGKANVNEINRINILQASLLSMKRAVSKLNKKPSLFLIDGINIPKNIKSAKSIIKGDEKIKCISAASIIAKVYRDLHMIKLSKKFPRYLWNKNFGYGTSYHLKAIKKYGITKHHRRKFKPVHNILIQK